MKYCYLFCALILLISSNHAVGLSSEKTLQHGEVNQIVSDAARTQHYITHMWEGGLAHLNCIACLTAGFLIGEIALKCDVPTLIHRTFKLNPPLDRPYLSTRYDLIVLTSLVPLLMGLARGLYVIYKTPQRTDTYVLKNNRIRTMKENIIVFLSRVLLIYPIGICMGEDFILE